MTITGETRTDKQLAENALMGKLIRHVDQYSEYIGIVHRIQHYWEFLGVGGPDPYSHNAHRIVVTFRSNEGSEYMKWLDQGTWEVWR